MILASILAIVAGVLTAVAVALWAVMAARYFVSHTVGRRVFLRYVSVVMACHAYNAVAPKADDGHRFEASWSSWGPLKIMVVRELFPRAM